MVVIRLARAGRIKSPFYRIVVADKRARRDGSFIEQIGTYNPVHKGEEPRLVMDKERLTYWLSQGSQPTDTVHRLMKELENPNKPRQRGKKRNTAVAEAAPAEVAPAEAAPAEAAPAEVAPAEAAPAEATPAEGKTTAEDDKS